MKIAAIICEFNPFHKGHEYILAKARETLGEDFCIACIMSRSFTQRGLPALYPYNVRAKAALLSGADLVLELPFPWSASGAADFAFGGVSIAKAIGADCIFFGSECGDIEKLAKTAENISSQAFNSALSDAVKSNKEKQYAKVRENVYLSLYGEVIPTSPNDILAVEYIKALKNTSITPLTFRRLDGLSASDIRKLINENELINCEFLPDDVKAIYNSELPYDNDKFSCACMTLLKMYKEDGKDIYSLPDGMLSRILALAKEKDSLPDMLLAAATKKYTNALIRREILHIILGTKAEDVKTPPSFTRLLGANKKGRAALKEISFPILSRDNESEIRTFSEGVKKQIRLLHTADTLYSLGEDGKRVSTPVIVE